MRGGGAPELRAPLATGRLLILPAFPPRETRITADLAARRNAIVSALATDTLILHATPGGRLETSLRQKLLPLTTPCDSPSRKRVTSSMPALLFASAKPKQLSTTTDGHR